MMNRDDYLAAIRSGEMTLQGVPRKDKDHQLCLAAVHANGRDLKNVPKHFRSKAVCYSAVFQNADAIKFVPQEILEEEAGILELALGRKGTLLEWAAEHAAALLTKRLCEKAVNSYGLAIKWVPTDFRTKEMVRTAVIRDGIVLMALQGEDQMIQDVAHEVSIKHLPDQFKTREICLAQVAKQGRLLQYVPLRILDDDILDAALNSNPWAMEFVPAHLASSPAVKDAILRGGVPKHMIEGLKVVVG